MCHVCNVLALYWKRSESCKITRYAPLSRGVAGVRKRSIIINLPGSPNAVRESVPLLLPVVDHAIDKLQGDKGECAEILKNQ